MLPTVALLEDEMDLASTVWVRSIFIRLPRMMQGKHRAQKEVD